MRHINPALQKWTILFLIVLTAHPASAQWTRTAGPEGGFAAALLVTPHSLLAGLESGGVYRSTDSGATWIFSSTGLTGAAPGADCFATLGSIIFVGTGTGIGRSLNEGLTWEYVNNGLPPLGASVTGIVVQGTSVFFGAYGDGVYRSTDSGGVWTKTSIGLTDTTVMAVYAYGSFLYAGTDGSGVFRSSDGVHWQSMSSGLASGGGSRVVSFGSLPGTLIVGTREGAYRSTNNGDTWTLASSGLTSVAVSVVFATGTDLFAGTYGNGAYRSTNNGVDWQLATTGWQGGNVRAFCTIGNTIFGGSYGSPVVYMSTDKGGSWQPSGNGITGELTYAIAATGNGVFAATADGVARTTDGGATWSYSPAPLGRKAVYAIAATSGWVFAGSAGDGPYRSSDLGVSWASASVGLSTSASRAIQSFAVDSPWVYIGTRAGVYSSSDNGASWSPAKSGLTDTVISALCAWHGLILAGAQSRMYRSTNGGSSWAEVSNGLPPDPATSIVHADSVFFASFYLGSNPSVYRSTDGGLSWNPSANGPPGSPEVIRTLYASGRWVYGGSPAYGVWLREKTEDAWLDISNGLIGPGQQIAGLTESGGYMYGAALKGGVWKRPVNQVVSVPQTGASTAIPEGLVLQQNFPNPFNPSTVIAYDLHGTAPSTVSLRVYDLLGREVATLVNERQEPGSHTVRFSGAGLASGVYYYRLMASGNTDTRRMLLIR